MSKKFNFSDEDMESLNVSIFDDFVLSAMESESADDIDDDLDDYDPEDDDCDDCDDCCDSDYDEEIDGDADPAEEEDDDYDDVVECSGLANMMPSIDSLDFTFALEDADDELERLEREYDEDDDDDDDDDSDKVSTEFNNSRVKVKIQGTIFDKDGGFEDDTADDILGLFDNDEDDDDDDDYDPEED